MKNTNRRSDAASREAIEKLRVQVRQASPERRARTYATLNCVVVRANGCTASTQIWSDDEGDAIAWLRESCERYRAEARDLGRPGYRPVFAMYSADDLPRRAFNATFVEGGLDASSIK